MAKKYFNDPVINKAYLRLIKSHKYIKTFKGMGGAEIVRKLRDS